MTFAKPLSRQRWSVLAIGCCFGALAAIFEQIAYLNNPLLRDSLWYSTIIDLLLFNAPTLLLLCLHRAVSPRALAAASVALCSWLLAFDVITLVRPGHPTPLWIHAASLAISAGSTIVFLLIEARIVRWHRPIAALLTAYVVIYVAFVPLHRRFVEHRALAAAKAPASAPNVVVIIVDALRADHLSAYGYKRETSPNLTRLAAEGTLFENAVAPSSWTLPSHASLLTGQLPSVHRAGQPAMSLGDSFPTLGEAYQALGYRTAGFSANCFLFSRRVGLDRGFTHFEDGSMIEKFVQTNMGMHIHNVLAHLHLLKDVAGRQSAAEINRDALRWIDRNRPPFFVVLNYFDVHEPFMPPHRYLEKFSAMREPLNQFYWPEDINLDSTQVQDEIDAYDASIAYVDDQIGHLVDALNQRHLSQNTILVITSDHGESFNEHGFMFHGKALYWELIHSPFIMVGPGIPPGAEVSAPVATQSLPATLMEVTTQHASTRFPGPSLVPLLKQPSPSWEPVVSQLAGMGSSPRFPDYYGPVSSVVTWQWHYILGSKRSELYRCCQENVESQNMVQGSDGKAAATALHEMLTQETGIGSFDASAQAAQPGSSASEMNKKKINEALHSLGYVN